MRTRCGMIPVVALAFTVLVPLAASAQSAFSGVVKDTSGAVLPGVTVEAASPVLIEKTRSVVTDAGGLYKIVDLRPGVYSLTFTLEGFSPLTRQNLELSTNVTVPLNVDLKVGGINESITVSGATPLVDVVSAEHAQVLSRTLIDSLPVTRNSMTVGAVVPGVKMNRPDVGGSQMMEQVQQTVHGSVNKDTTMQVDGMIVNSSMNDRGIQAYNDDAMNAEVSVQTSALTAEVSAGGLRINMIPKDGGNTFSGGGYFGGTPEQWQSSNIDDALRAKGMVKPNGIQHIQDFNGSVGGPILRDKLWFFGASRLISVNELVANAFYPDGSPAIVDQYVWDGLVRLTSQLTPKNKIAAYFERIRKFKGHEMNPGTDVVEASTIRDPNHALYWVGQAKYTSTISNKALLEAGFSANIERYTTRYQPGVEKTPFTPEWYAQAPRQDLVLTTLKKSPAAISYNYPDNYALMAGFSYVTGTHNFKTGFQWQFGQVGYRYPYTNAGLIQRYRSGVPDSVAVQNTPTSPFTYVNCDCGFYVQDSYTFKRATIYGGLRIDHFNSKIMATDVPAGRFLPARHFAEVPDYPNWTDFAPRFSMTYDLFGTSKTALKASVNKYMTSWAGGWAARYNPTNYAADIRTWKDLNADDIAQDNEIGPSTNKLWGVGQSRFPDPNLRREYNIETAVSVQHQLLPRMSVFVGYFRRDFRNVENTVNTLVTQDDYTAFTATNPMTGEPITLYNLKSNKLGQVHLVDTNSSINKRTYTGLEFSFNARLPKGGAIFGGLTSDHVVKVTCDTYDPNLLLYCDQSKYDIPAKWDLKIAGNYPLPFGFEASATWMNYAGNSASYIAGSSAEAGGGLGNNSEIIYWTPAASVFPNGQRSQSIIVPLNPPGQRYLDRWNQIDFEMKRRFSLGGNTVVTGQVDIYNLFNSNVITVQNQNFGSAQGQPMVILVGRILRAAVQIKF